MITRNSYSYAMINDLFAFPGGAAGQLSYPSSDAKSDDLGNTHREEEQNIVDSRAEAKKEHARRMSFLRNNDIERNQEQIDKFLDSQPKQSAFQIAVSVANAADSKVSNLPICFA